MLSVSDLKPANPNEVMLRHRPLCETGGLIYVRDDTSKDRLQFFDVVKVGADVTDVKVGETVLVDWTKMTDPMELYDSGKTVKCGFCHVSSVLAVVE